MNKRGIAAGQIALLVIAVLVVVLMALALMGVFGPIDEILGKASDLELSVQACNGFAQGGFRVSYCEEFQEVRFPGKSSQELVNCDFIKDRLDNILACDKDRKYELEFCQNAYEDADVTKRDDVLNLIVNNEECGAWGVSTITNT